MQFDAVDKTRGKWLLGIIGICTLAGMFYVDIALQAKNDERLADITERVTNIVGALAAENINRRLEGAVGRMFAKCTGLGFPEPQCRAIFSPPRPQAFFREPPPAPAETPVAPE